ncbi:hypothetical protein VTI28DRAFT_9342 [Corynascus sepedonium]
MPKKKKGKKEKTVGTRTKATRNNKQIDKIHPSTLKDHSNSIAKGGIYAYCQLPVHYGSSVWSRTTPPASHPLRFGLQGAYSGAAGFPRRQIQADCGETEGRSQIRDTNLAMGHRRVGSPPQHWVQFLLERRAAESRTLKTFEGTLKQSPGALVFIGLSI